MAFIAEAIVSKVIEELITLPIEEAKQQVRLVVGVKGEVNKMVKNLRAIQAVLHDAEQKQLKDKSIRVWLGELKEISYDIDDVLDEWRSEMIKMSREHVEVDSHTTASSSHIKEKVCSFLPSCCFRCGEIGLRHDIALRIKELNESLDDIAIRRDRFGLSDNIRGGVDEHQVQQRRTISYIDTADVKGRARENKKIVGMLLNESDNVAIPKIISIVGVGGLGKTTLAQSAYNDRRVKDHFNERVWVCVSKPFDEIRVGKAILESLLGSFERDGVELQTIVEKIRERIREKKFLVVLDDVWNKVPDNWKNIKAALHCGLPGSTILVTTRDIDVAKSMRCIERNIFQPNHLSKKDCWDIISSVVASSGMQTEKLQELQDVGLQIAGKCKGFPLAAKAFGGVLRFRETREEWKSMLDSDIWRLGEEEVVIERELFAPLWLSYQDLSCSERQCLTYCGLYPKDHEFIKTDLIRSWMAQGYLKETKTKDMRIVGEECFRNLGACSFFQDFKKDDIGRIYGFKMHDIVHDFVIFISQKECLHIEELTSLREARHIRLDRTSRLDKFPDTIFSMKKLRTLEVEYFKGVDLSILFNKLTCLRSLCLFSCSIEKLSSTIGRLVHLRQLKLHGNMLRSLPEEVGDLQNLLILDLTECGPLFSIPSGIERLSNLRYLNTRTFGIERLSNLRYLNERTVKIRLTQGIGKLHALREATFLVGGSDNVDDEAASLRNLKNLCHLNSVDLILGRDMSHVDGTKQAQLNQKKHLTNLTLKFDFLIKIYENADKWKLHDEEFIEVFVPCADLEHLEIYNYLGTKPCPSWLLSLNHLTSLVLYEWSNCTLLPPLGKLCSLTHLFLAEMKVTSVGHEFLGKYSHDLETTSSFVAFPRLTSLTFSHFREWRKWNMNDSTSFTIMPRLTRLELIYCPKLMSLPDHLLCKTTLNTLKITNCEFLGKFYDKDGVYRAKISHIPDIVIKVTAGFFWAKGETFQLFHDHIRQTITFYVMKISIFFHSNEFYSKMESMSPKSLTYLIL